MGASLKVKIEPNLGSFEKHQVSNEKKTAPSCLGQIRDS